jgi:hypothetical protein
MKSLMSLWRELANELASWCCTSAIRDIKTVTDRVEAEGDSFLTITLPQYAKDFERSLELGSIAPTGFLSFKKSGSLPAFLRGFLEQIFDSRGVLLDEPNIDCIRAVRELTLVFGRIERPCTPARVSHAMRRFVEIEAELEGMDTNRFAEFLPLFQKSSTLLWGDVFAHVENTLNETHHLAFDWVASENLSEASVQSDRRVNDPYFRSFFPIWEKEVKGQIIDPASVDLLKLVPRHGPGATADRLLGNQKYSVREWPVRLERSFPYGDYALASWRYYDQLDQVEFLEPGTERPVKVTAVPKTLKRPRIIAIEPTSMQYCQQALAQCIVNALENWSKITPTRGGKDSALGRFFVGFEQQEPNRLLAQEGSRDGLLATLDLSDASDRVLNQHVRLLVSRFPCLDEAIQACRSQKADVPGEGVIPLTKFASMGSALCFPVEAMVFTTIIFAAIAYERRTPLTRQLILEMKGKVRVYGDDIVVPVEYVPRVIQFLQAFGLVVNMDKSFWNGKFRESCGGDYFDGEWVSPIRLTKDLPRSLADVDSVVAAVSFRNRLYWGGYWKTASVLDEMLRPLLKGAWPIVERTAAGLGRESALPYKAEKIDPHLHTPLVRGAIVKSVTPASLADGPGSLLKYFIKRSDLPSQDPKHLERQGRPVASSIKLRGIRPY